MKKKSSEMNFLEHLQELRLRLIYILVILGVGFILCFIFSEDIIKFITRSVKNYDLIFISPTELFFANLKVAFFSAIIISSPYTIYQLWKFISPGLLPNEKKYALPFIILATLFFILGLAFAYLIVLPYGLKFLLNYRVSDIVTPRISISNYISFFMTFLLIFGVIFELPLITFFLSRLNILSYRTLIKWRKYAILVIFIVSAILTPPDVFTQILMALPILILYEVSILIARVFGKR